VIPAAKIGGMVGGDFEKQIMSSIVNLFYSKFNIFSRVKLSGII
jgi:hypothetical protein